MAVGPQVIAPVGATMTKTNGVMKIEEIIHAEPPRLLILFDKDQEEIVRAIADVLGQAYIIVDTLEGVLGRSGETVVGLENKLVLQPAAMREVRRTAITTHAIDIQDLRDEDFTAFCDYEYLYTQNHFVRREVSFSALQTPAMSAR